MAICANYFKLKFVLIVRTLFRVRIYATDEDLVFEYAMIGSVFPLTTVLSTVTDSTFSISGNENIVFNKIDSNIDHVHLFFCK